jgi:hypothetical protein
VVLFMIAIFPSQSVIQPRFFVVILTFASLTSTTSVCCCAAVASSRSWARTQQFKFICRIFNVKALLGLHLLFCLHCSLADLPRLSGLLEHFSEFGTGFGTITMSVYLANRTSCIPLALLGFVVGRSTIEAGRATSSVRAVSGRMAELPASLGPLFRRIDDDLGFRSMEYNLHRFFCSLCTSGGSCNFCLGGAKVRKRKEQLSN